MVNLEFSGFLDARSQVWIDLEEIFDKTKNLDHRSKHKLTLNDDFCGRNSLSSSKSRNFYEEWREFLWERVWVKCVCVGVVFGQEKEREERRESGWGDGCMEAWDFSMETQQIIVRWPWEVNSLFLLWFGPRMERGKGKNWALYA